MNVFKYFICLFSLFLIHSNLFAQSWGDSSIKDQPLFHAVEVNPKFPGGTKGLYKFIGNNLEIPKGIPISLARSSVQVRIYLSDAGKVIFAEVQQDHLQILSEDQMALNKAAIRLISKMPAWSPATQNKHKVPCTFVLPVIFIN
jgi:hypothetical protein